MPGSTSKKPRKVLFNDGTTSTETRSTETSSSMSPDSTFSSLSTEQSSSQDASNQKSSISDRIARMTLNIADAAEAEARLKEIEALIKELNENKTEQDLLLTRQELVALKQHLLQLQQKIKKWFNRDAAAGTTAAIAIAALYAGVEKVRNFLPPSIANLIMPFFIIADISTAICAWKIALLNREITLVRRELNQKLHREESESDKRSAWIGSRNSLLRAIFETFWAAVGSAVVLGAIITSTFLASAVAGSFAVFIAPVFMLVLGTRTIFNAASSLFHVIRAYREQTKADNADNKADKDKFAGLANHYKRIAKIQAFAAAASGIGFIATTLVMLTHHFSFGFVGVAGGLALGGFMAYLFHGNSKFSSGLKVDEKVIANETKSLENKLDGLEATQKEKAQKLAGFLPNFVNIAKKVGRFVLPVSLPEAAGPSATTNDELAPSSHRDIQLSIIERDNSKDKNPEETPDINIVEIKSGDYSAKIRVDRHDASVLTKTRFGLYAPRVAAERAEDGPKQKNSLKMSG